jgi:serine/threonine protein kinase
MGETSALICEAIVNAIRLPRFASISEIPPKLEDIINKALEKDRNLRYQGAAEMRADLQRLKRDTETGRAIAASSGTVAVAVQEQWMLRSPTAISISRSSPACSLSGEKRR